MAQQRKIKFVIRSKRAMKVLECELTLLHDVRYYINETMYNQRTSTKQNTKTHKRYVGNIQLLEFTQSKHQNGLDTVQATGNRRERQAG